jgi:hypothetical protein
VAKKTPHFLSFVSKSLYMIKYAHPMTYMIKCIQVAIIQAFTALWKIKFKQMVVLLNLGQEFTMNFLHSLSKLSLIFYQLQNDRHLLKFYLSESCKSLNKTNCVCVFVCWAVFWQSREKYKTLNPCSYTKLCNKICQLCMSFILNNLSH